MPPGLTASRKEETIYHDPAITRFSTGSMRCLCLAALVALSACNRMDEDAMRAQLSRYFAVGETIGYVAKHDCVAGAFHLTDVQIGAAMPVAGNVPKVVRLLETQGRAALDDERQSPDAALVALSNAERGLGLRMRRIGLDARMCMDDVVLSAFGHVLTAPSAILAFENEQGLLIVLDPRVRIVVVAQGAGA